MPKFDGTGPQGEGPLSGRGEGYCAVRLPDQPDQPASGFAGLQGRPFSLRMPRLGLGLRRGRGRSGGRGRGRGGRRASGR